MLDGQKYAALKVCCSNSKSQIRKINEDSKNPAVDDKNHVTCQNRNHLYEQNINFRRNASDTENNTKGLDGSLDLKKDGAPVQANLVHSRQIFTGPRNFSFLVIHLT